jgi:hypothetical protein
MNDSERNCEDFHTFDPMKEDLRRGRRRYSLYEKVFGAVQNWLKTQPKCISSDGI